MKNLLQDKLELDEFEALGFARYLIEPRETELIVPDLMRISTACKIIIKLMK